MKNPLHEQYLYRVYVKFSDVEMETGPIELYKHLVCFYVFAKNLCDAQEKIRPIAYRDYHNTARNWAFDGIDRLDISLKGVSVRLVVESEDNCVCKQIPTPYQQN